MTTYKLSRKGVIAVIPLILAAAGAQATTPWTDLGLEDNASSPSTTSSGIDTRLIQPKRARLIKLDGSAVRTLLSSLRPAGQETTAGAAAQTLTVPMPDGSQLTFQLTATEVMAPELAARYPEIRTFAGTVEGQPHIRARFDFSPRGLRAQIFTPKGEVYIDPLSHENTQVHQVYYTRDLAPRISRQADTVLRPLNKSAIAQAATQAAALAPTQIGDKLLTYRVAIATTGEYAKFHDPKASPSNKGGVLAELVTLVNRVTGIYERDVGIRLQLIGKEDSLIFTNGSTDPYTNSKEKRMLSQNIPVLKNTIGNAAFDIGHVVGTGGGGVANLGAVCDDASKAGGATGDPKPVTDAFYVDYVAHEMGHQFGADHTFNSSSGACSGNREPKEAFEPGSGTTIMGYAGICSPHNIAEHSDPNFHASSIVHIVGYTRNGGGKICAQVSASGNTAPVAKVPAGDFTIPISTPFELTGQGSDTDGDALTYQWEQMDLGRAGNPNSPGVSSPLFRSYPPSANPTRSFPQMTNLLANRQVMGEILPNVSRSLNFRLTVRDNRVSPSSGGVSTADLAFNVSANAGPFKVTTPNTAAVYPVNSQLLVQWNVAKTDVAPVSCAAVHILLSTNGGNSFSALASNAPNSGAYAVNLPATPTNQARIKIKCSSNVFFDVSDTNFTIQ